MTIACFNFNGFLDGKLSMKMNTMKLISADTIIQTSLLIS